MKESERMKRADLIYKEDDICIIGMSGQFPMAKNILTYWENLLSGKDCITRNEEMNQEDYVGAFGALEDVNLFDHSFFDISKFDAQKMDFQQRKLLEQVYAALQNAGYGNRKKDTVKTGLYVSVPDLKYVYEDLYCNHAYDGKNSSMLGMYTGSAVATRISYLLNLTGPTIVFNGACASSLVGINLARKSLQNKECTHCIVAACTIEQEQDGYYVAENAISSDGYTRAYDQNGTGFVPGSAVAAVVLKRYADAVRDRDHIFAVIKSACIGNDGNRKIGFTAPSIQGEYEVVSGALREAEMTPDDVVYIEGHGTATPLGDSVEICALKKAYKGRNGEKLKIGSVKSNIGHTDTVAGLAGLIKAAYSLQNRIIPKTLYCDTINEEITRKTPISVLTENMPLSEETAGIIGVSSFGIGGVNAHIILQEAPQVEQSVPDIPAVIPMSAKSKASLQGAIQDFQQFSCMNTTSLVAVQQMYQMYQSQWEYRTFLFGKQWSDFSREQNVVLHQAFPEKQIKVVFVFPGGGSQFSKMGQELYRNHSIFRKYFHDCMEILKEKECMDLFPYISGSVETVQTVSEGLCLIFSISYSLARFLIALGIHPNYLMGSSFGEYTAACLSGVLQLQDALSLVAARGRLIEKTKKGAMLSICMNRNQLETMMEGIHVEISAINFKNRFLVSGKKEDIDQLYQRLEQNGFQATYMHMENAGHCYLVEEIMEEFQKIVEKIPFGTAQIPIISSYKGDFVQEDEMQKSSFWCNHMRKPVNFYDAAQKLMKEENLIFIEVGTGMQLSTFLRKIYIKHPSKNVISLIPYEEESEWDQVLQAVGELWSSGLSVNWNQVYVDVEKPGQKVSVPSYHFSGNLFQHSVNQECFKKDENILIVNGTDPLEYEKTKYIVKNCSGKVVFAEPEEAFYQNNDGIEAVFQTVSDLQKEFYQRLFQRHEITMLQERDHYEEDANQFVASCILDYLRKHEAFDESDVYTIDKLCCVLNVLEEYHPYITYFIQFLLDYHYVKSEYGMITFLPSCKQVPSKEKAFQYFCEQHPDCSSHVAFCNYISGFYDDIFTGKVVANSVLYPNGSFDLIHKYDSAMPEFTYLDKSIEVLASIVGRIAKASNRKMRILEIGGGTGELTDVVLKQLEGIDFTYCFTDIGKSFVSSRKKADREAGRINMQYGVLDISKDVTMQGYLKHAYDIVICLDVIQATENLKKTLGNIQSLLADGGFFGMVETCYGSEVTNMIYGCAPGWWNYMKDSMRNRITMLPEQWMSLMQSCGFEAVTVFPEKQETDTYTFIMRNAKKYCPACRILNQEKANQNLQELQKLAKSSAVIAWHDQIDFDALSKEYHCERIVVPDDFDYKKDSKKERDSSGNAYLEELKEIANEILDVEDISERDRLVDIGFDSLSGLMLSSQLQDKYGVKIGVADLFGCDTLADICELLQKELQTDHTANTISSVEVREASEKNIDDFLNDFGL